MNQAITIARQAVNTAETTAHEIKKAVTAIPQDLLSCGKCKMKKEPTTDNIELFGYTKNGSMFRNCMKFRLFYNTYKQQKLNNSTEDNHQTCTRCLKVKQVTGFTETGKQFKQCNGCRNKPKQKLIALKDARLALLAQQTSNDNREKILFEQVLY